MRRRSGAFLVSACGFDQKLREEILPGPKLLTPARANPERDFGLASWVPHRAALPKMEVQAKRVLILGAGFGGLYTALSLEKTVARDPGARVTIVNRENHSLFTPMLHEVAVSDLDMTHIVNPI
jgi:hypothetical protein